MPVQIKMPKLSDTMTEGVLVKWSVKPGDKVKTGDTLGEVETDKAVMPIENFDEGFIAATLIEEGQSVPVGQPIALIANAGEDWQQVSQQASGGGKAGAAAPSRVAEAKPDAPRQHSEQEAQRPVAAGAPQAAAAGQSAGGSPATLNGGVAVVEADGRIKASPLAKKMAKDEGIDLQALRGSGPGGRIVQDDVLAAIEKRKTQQPQAAATPAGAPAANDSEIKVTGLRKVIAQRLQESKQTIPHFYVEMEVLADKLMTLREQLKAALPETKITVNDLVIRATALAIRKVPAVNASWQGDKIIQKGAIDIGVGVAIEGGLVVPVVRRADTLALTQIAKQVRDLATRAKDRKLAPNEMTASTFTISNMGMYGITRFNAIVNPPESAILAVGTTRKEPIVVDDQVKIGQKMSLTLSADHRVIDGATAAQFLIELKKLLEEPLTMLV